MRSNGTNFVIFNTIFVGIKMIKKLCDILKLIELNVLFVENNFLFLKPLVFFNRK